MPLSLKSVDAATSPVVGSVMYFDTPKITVGCDVMVVSGSPSFHVDLEGTLDGVTWRAMTFTDNGEGFLVGVHVPVVAARANLTSISGGAVTVWLAAAE